MSNWNYQREERGGGGTTGKQRCVIVNAEEKISKSGNPMIEISVRPSGCKFTVKTYLVQGEYFNRNATAFFDAFPEIPEGNFNLLEWVGAEGAAMFDTDDRGYLKVKYFIDSVKAADLPPFEGDKPERQTVTSLEDDEPGADDFDDDGDLPFV